ADGVGRGGKLGFVAGYSRPDDKRAAFAAKSRCRAAQSYDETLHDPTIDAVVNTTPNSVHLETTRAAAQAGKHVFLDKPIANTVSDGSAISQCARKAGIVLALG